MLFKNSKRYSTEDKLKYHTKRDLNPKGFGLVFGEPKHSYSMGYLDGFDGTNNSRFVESHYGKRSSISYEFGRKRGLLARKKIK